MKGRCRLCKKNGMVTKHSLIGSHKPPYVILCEECHKKVHGFVPLKKAERIEIRRWKNIQFKRKLPYLCYN